MVSLTLRPKLIINDYNNNLKVLSDITSELTMCKKFMLCGAFITSSGITPLLETLRYIEKNNINYHDRFISNSQLIAISKSGRTLDSTDVKQIYSAEADGISMNLFVRKNKDDNTSKEFYYLGKIKVVGKPHKFTMKNTIKNSC